MSFIETIPPATASGPVRELYRQQQGKLDYLPNYARVFCYRPEVMTAWAALQRSLQENLDSRRYSLVTLAAAQAMGSTYCALAHARKLALRYYTEAELLAIIRGDRRNPLAPADRRMMSLARKVALDSSAVRREDIQGMRDVGFSDAQVFDIVAAAAARCFFARVPDALGVQADPELGAALGALVKPLSLGRPVAQRRAQAGSDSDPAGPPASLYARVWRVLHYSLTGTVGMAWRRRITRRRLFTTFCARALWRG